MSRYQRIYDLLQRTFSPVELMVCDESHQHHVPQGSESHFKLTVVSARFENLSRIARHRLINDRLSDEFTRGLHALSLHLYTPEEWEQTVHVVPDSPKCRGGMRHDG